VTFFATYARNLPKHGVDDRHERPHELWRD